MENASLITLPQLSYRHAYQAVLEWLLGLNPRRIEAYLPLVAGFLAGVLWARTATCAAIGRGGVFSHDALNRLLIGPALRGLLQMAALTMVKRQTGYLVVDDVVIEKFGPAISGIAWLFSPSLEKKVRALNVVVLGWTNGKWFIPLTFRFWKRPEFRDEKGKPSELAFDGSPFKTKLELAIDMLAWARGRGFTPIAVLFDAYYLAKPVLRFLKRSDWHWVSRMKGNRKLKRGKKTFQADRWAELARAGQAPRLTRSVTAALPDWGDVRLIAVRHKADQKFRFLVGSNPNWSRDAIDRLYGHRWDIEVGFRNTKQLAGLGDCQCRSFRAQENHVALVFLAYLFIVRQSQHGETVGAVIHRLNGAAVMVLAPSAPPKVRPVMRERRRRSGDGRDGRISGYVA